MVKHYIHVLSPLVASNLALEHGVGYSHVGCHVALIKIAQNSLEHVVNHILVPCSRTGIQRDELTLSFLYLPL